MNQIVENTIEVNEGATTAECTICRGNIRLPESRNGLTTCSTCGKTWRINVKTETINFGWATGEDCKKIVLTMQ